MTKALSLLISFVLITAIIIVAITVVLFIGLPAIDRAKDAALISEAKNIMQSIDNAARQVLFEGNGAQRVFSVSATGGDYFVEKDTDSVKFKLNSISGIIDPGTRKMEGNLLITAGTDVKTYETNYSADPSLVGYWKLNAVNGTNYTPDFTPNRNDGLMKNFANPPSQNFTAGKIGGALQFDGVDDYVNISPSQSLNSITSQITIEAWIKTNTLSQRQTIVANWFYNKTAVPNIGNRSYMLILENGTYAGKFYFALSPYGINYTDVKGLSSNISISVNQWVYVVATSNGANMSLYVNGVFDTIGPAPIQINPSNVSQFIGMWYAEETGKSPSTVFFNGTIDEVRIYNRSLSADEIRRHYYQGLKKLELGTNLVLENSHVIFEVPKFGLPSSFAAINNSQLVDKITIKDSGLNITPADSSTIVDNSLLSVNGTGYTQLMHTGDLLREASIKAYIQSDSGANYEIWYTLRSNADFILQEIKNIVYR